MRILPALPFALLLAAPTARAQLSALSSFNPSAVADLCGAALDPISGNVWVYGCSAATLSCYTSGGVLVTTLARPGESANDVDLEFTPQGINLGGTLVPEGTLLFINGETGVAEVYALDKSSGAVLATLVTSFGASHVVGGAFHRARDTFFLLQDKVPGGVSGNLVAEIDAVSGAVLQSFQVSSAGFIVNYGDLDIGANGNLLLVSSDESTLAEFTPAGALLQELALPAGVSSLSGLALHESDGGGWVASTTGVVTQLAGLPQAFSLYCTAGTTTNGCVPSLSASGLPIVGAPAGFVLTASAVEGQKQGLLFYGVSGQAISPWGTGGSYLCVKSPTQRSAVQNSAGVPGACDGVLSLDWSAFAAANPSALGAPFAAGLVVDVQAWFRDPPSAKTTALSGALEFVLQP